ncbi:Nuclear pore complex protein [Abeliophyllum distichum]|uniref:Nuclear pore complex protein n=1 Tax=Abeliophyllum distichum TaxID=126358 RepID=A0ABD1VWG0_9LAMI
MDSILVAAWSDGQLQIDASADEIQLVWKVGSAPRVCVDSYHHILCAAMNCESVPPGLSVLKFDQPRIIRPGHSIASLDSFTGNITVGVYREVMGPLRNVYHSLGEDSEVQIGVCEGRAVSFLYNLVSKDSILVAAWSGGQLQIDALADEIQPVWKVGSAPHVSVDSYDHILGAAMICESVPTGFSVLKFDQPQNHTG